MPESPHLGQTGPVIYSNMMVNESGEARCVQTRRPLTVSQRIWFAAVFPSRVCLHRYHSSFRERR